MCRSARLNYALYTGNGPELEADAGEIEAIMADGFTRDADGRPVIGGRLGLLPLPKLEIGVSAARAGDGASNMGAPLTGDPVRDYAAYGADLGYSTGGLRLLAEYITQKVGRRGGECCARCGRVEDLVRPAVVSVRHAGMGSRPALHRLRLAACEPGPEAGSGRRQLLVRPARGCEGRLRVQRRARPAPPRTPIAPWPRSPTDSERRTCH